MPTSSKVNKDWIRKRFLESVPKDATVLDVGIGEGTYANMLRPSRPEQFWIGVEAFEPYVDQYDLAKRYDQVMVLDIRHWNYSKEGIDCVIFGDVLEHMTRAEAMNCVMNALQWARDVFISVPVGHVPQGAVNGNEFERHRHDWDSAAFCTAFSRNIDDAVLEHDPLMRNILMGAYHLKAR